MCYCLIVRGGEKKGGTSMKNKIMEIAPYVLVLVITVTPAVLYCSWLIAVKFLTLSDIANGIVGIFIFGAILIMGYFAGESVWQSWLFYGSNEQRRLATTASLVCMVVGFLALPAVVVGGYWLQLREIWMIVSFDMAIFLVLLAIWRGVRIFFGDGLDPWQVKMLLRDFRKLCNRLVLVVV